MKTIIIATAILAASVAPGVAPVFATSDGDHDARPRPEFRQVQKNHPWLQVPRVNTNAPGVTSGIAHRETTTTSFGQFGFIGLDEQPSVEPLSQDSVERP